MKPTALADAGVHIITGSSDTIKTQFEKWKEVSKDKNILIVNVQFTRNEVSFGESHTMYITYVTAL